MSQGTGGKVGTGGAVGPAGSGGASAPDGGASGGKTGSADAGTDGGTVATGTPCDAPTKVFAMKCALSGCHSPGGFPPDLSTDKAAASLVGLAQFNPCAADTKSSIVNPNAPLGGSLFLWITGPTCREQMPFGGTPLSADDVACVRSYFTAKIK